MEVALTSKSGLILTDPELEGGEWGLLPEDGCGKDEEEVVTDVTTIEEPSDEIVEDDNDDTIFTEFIVPSLFPFAIPETEELSEVVVLVIVTLLIGWTEDDPDDSWPLEGEDIEEVVDDGEAFRPPRPLPLLLLLPAFNSRSNRSSLG